MTPNLASNLTGTTARKPQVLEALPPQTTTSVNILNPYFKSSNFVLYNADCLEIMKKLPDNYVDMVFADPPYFLSESKADLSYKGDWDLSRGVKENTKFQLNWIKEAKRILKPEGTIWITGTHYSIYQCGYCLQILDFRVLNDIAWFKPKKDPFSRNFFNFSHETIIWAKKDKTAKHYLNPKVLDVEYRDKLNREGQHMGDVWDILPCSKKEIDWHPTPKPVDLLKRIILASTKPGSIILDPFNGSGTTGIATLELGFNRKYIGIDLDQSYLDKTVERYHKAINQNIVNKSKVVETNIVKTSAVFNQSGNSTQKDRQTDQSQAKHGFGQQKRPLEKAKV